VEAISQAKVDIDMYKVKIWPQTVIYPKYCKTISIYLFM
jgi:hypothetical protein